MYVYLGTFHLYQTLSSVCNLDNRHILSYQSYLKWGTFYIYTGPCPLAFCFFIRDSPSITFMIRFWSLLQLVHFLYTVQSLLTGSLGSKVIWPDKKGRRISELPNLRSESAIAASRTERHCARHPCLAPTTYPNHCTYFISTCY